MEQDFSANILWFDCFETNPTAKGQANNKKKTTEADSIIYGFCKSSNKEINSLVFLHIKRLQFSTTHFFQPKNLQLKKLNYHF